MAIGIGGDVGGEIGILYVLVLRFVVTQGESPLVINEVVVEL